MERSRRVESFSEVVIEGIFEQGRGQFLKMSILGISRYLPEGPLYMT